MNNELLPSFIRDVHITDEYYDESADAAYVEISYEQYHMIKKAQRFIKKIEGYSVTTFDYTPEWFNRTDDGIKPFEELTLNDLTPNENISIETLELKITSDSIYWSGFIKHTSIEIYTDSIPIKELDHNFKVLGLPLEDMPTHINHSKFESSKKLVKERLNRKI